MALSPGYHFFAIKLIDKADVPMDKTLLEILACPICKGELIYEQANQEMICRFDRLAYPIVNDIPIMLETRARRLGSEEE